MILKKNACLNASDPAAGILFYMLKRIPADFCLYSGQREKVSGVKSALTFTLKSCITGAVVLNAALTDYSAG